MKIVSGKLGLLLGLLLILGVGLGAVAGRNMLLDHGLSKLKGPHAREAIRYLKPLAYVGDPVAQSTLGDLYALGIGVEKDESEAMTWFGRLDHEQRAARKFEVGERYLEGLGVQQDEAEGVKWIQHSAQDGYAPAQALLAKAYEQGLYGLRRDPVKSQHWTEQMSTSSTSGRQTDR